MRQLPFGPARSRAATRPGERLTFGKTYRIAIPAGSTSVNLRTLADAANYRGESGAHLVFTLAPGDTLTATNTATPAVTRGDFGRGAKVVLQNRGTIRGKGGAGGTAGTAPGIGNIPPAGAGGPGSPGGTAIDASDGELIIDNAGTIGGGSGGNGGSGGGAVNDGGEGTPVAGTVGAAGTDGGGAAGSTGASGSSFGPYTGAAGGAGGAAGKYIDGIDNVTFRNQGTLLGTSA